MSILGKLAKKKKTPTKKTNSKPLLKDNSLNSNIKDFLNAKKKQKEAKAEIARAEGAIIEAAERARIVHCTRTGKYESSHKVASDEGQVTVKFPNRYSKIPTDDEDGLREVFDDDYDRYFETKTEVTMTDAALNDESFIEEMLEKLGEEKFEEYFDVSAHIAVKKHYHENRVTDSKLAEKHKYAVDQGLVTPTKPGLVPD